MNRTTIPLNFGWEFHPNFRDEYLEKWYKVGKPQLVDFPHSSRLSPFNGFSSEYYQSIFSYRKLINIPKKWRGKVLMLRFGGVAVHIEVYLNGVFCAAHNGAYLPFEIDLTNLVTYGENNLLVFKVSSHEDETVPPFGGRADFLTYGGVYREVELDILSPEHITDIFVTTDVSGNSKKWEVDVEINSINLENRLRLSLAGDNELEDVILAEQPLRELTMSFKGELEDVEIWSLENPRLYTLKTELIRGCETLDSVRTKIGFRKVELTDEGVVLNDRKIKLIGLNRHQSYPEVGYAMPKSGQYDDADFLKSLGLNVVRSSHYPPSKYFLDRCDEIGLLVLEEIPGWQYVSSDAVWRDRCLANVRDMIIRDRNHPSVIMWGVRINESDDDNELYLKANEIAKDYDPTRPTFGVRNFAHSELLEDVYTYNDFTNSGGRKKIMPRSKITKSKSPYLITEYNGHMFPTKSWDTEIRRTEHALRHAEVLDAILGADDIMGALGWCMSDYNTNAQFGSGDGVCYHGVSDMYRIPKLAAAVYQSQGRQSPVLEISSSMNVGDYSGGFIGDVYVFTNCDYIKLYAGGQLLGKFYPDRKRFPNLKHPPIKISDFTSARIAVDERLTAKNAKRVTALINAVLRYGQHSLPLKVKISALLLMLTQKKSRAECEQMVKKYIGGLGAPTQEYLFEGYKEEKLVISATRGISTKTQLIAECVKTELIETDTYDTTKVNLRFVNDHGAQAAYVNESVKIVPEGPVEVLGSSIVSLKGGAASVWIRSGNEAGVARVKFLSPFNDQELEFRVIKALT